MGETGCDIWGKGGVSANFKKNLDRASQAVAIFGTRRVTLGATVLTMELALGGRRAMYTRALANCGVDTGGTLTGGLWLHDLAGRHDVGATSLVGAAQAAGAAGEDIERFPAARFRCARLRGTSTSGSIYVFNVHRSSEQQVFPRKKSASQNHAP